ncbi:hypothetical protein JCM3765_000361 [Sporobolomyces pararoseus]
MNRFEPLPSLTLKTLSAQLYPDETLILHQDGVGLYDGKDKSPLHYEGRLHLTSHRLIFISSSSIPVGLQLSLVRQTEYWTGFLKSSPKITLLLHQNTETLNSSGEETLSPSPLPPPEPPQIDRSWICRVCGMKNIPSLELGLKCSLCGIKHESTSLAPPSISPYPILSTTTTNKIEPRPLGQEELLDPIETGFKLSCPVCTFLNHHSMNRCEMCDTLLPSFSSSSTTHTPRPSTPSTSSSSRPSTPSGTGGGGDFVRLSFRKGGINNFYNQLKEQLNKKSWDLETLSRRNQVDRIKLEVLKRKQKFNNKNGNSDENDLHKSSSGVGIDAILRGIDLESQTRTDSLEDALKDLESLMRKAKEMIQLAQSINSQLTSSSSTNTDSNSQASQLATTSLSSLGLLSSVAVTADQSKSEKEYHHSLARELASLLQPPRSNSSLNRDKVGLIEKRGGVIGLDELWCVWNRARGVALVSPKSLKLSVPYLPLYTSNPILKPLTFPQSGLTILHTPRYSPLAFKARLLEFIDETNSTKGGEEVEERDQVEVRGVGLLQVAKREQLSLGLTKEMIEMIELEQFEEAKLSRGEKVYGDGIVRDSGAGGEGSQGVRWYRDWITGFEWDGQD